MKHIYLCNKTLSKQLGINSQRKTEHHNIETNNDNTFIWPETVDKTCINPETYDSLKQALNIRTILIVDSIAEETSVIKTADHINKTGQNFLIKNTPYRDHPTFPDATNVYKNKAGKTFLSLGDRVGKTKNSSGPWVQSGWIAPIATVWSYVGVKVIGVGIGRNINTIEDQIKDNHGFI